MIKFNELYVTTIARGLCGPDERVVSACAGTRQPLWSLGLPWFRHSYLLIATNERLLVVDHRKGLIFDRLDVVTQHRWNEVASIAVRGVFSKSLVAKDLAGAELVSMKLPPALTSPVANNGRAAASIVQTWEHRTLGAAPAAYGALAALPVGRALPSSAS